MNIEEFKNKYEDMKDTDIYKSYCSVLDSKDLALKNVLREKQELIKYLKEKIKERNKDIKLIEEDVYTSKYAYQEILDKIEKR